MKQDLSREQVLAVALEDYRKNLPTPDNDSGKKTFELTKEQVLNNALSDYRKNLPTPDNDGMEKTVAPALPTLGKESLLKKISGAYNQNLIIAVVLIAGYFAYKKFKK